MSTHEAREQYHLDTAIGSGVMERLVLHTPRLHLTVETTEMTLARIDAMSPEDRAQVSPEWLAQLRASVSSPWTHGFAMAERATGAAVGSCGFKGPPDAEGAVEIAYGLDPAFQGRGYAKEAAAALVEFALQDDRVRVVRAHTLPEKGPSGSVLTANGFQCLGQVIDPEDGLVWRWERRR
jgi:RimJ/RimL family protein N-acetyltransferase